MRDETIGQRIHRLMREQGLNQSELADRIGITKAAVSQWLSDESPNIRPQNLLAVAAVLNTTPQYVVFGDPEALTSEEWNRVAQALRHAATFAEMQANDPKYRALREVLLDGALSDRALSDKCTRLATMSKT